ncbi:MAG: aminomethyl-transferring glycine dehydrogenase subunit GcvPB [Rhodospirillales bacterium]|nr:aminomethyl-transferring glycine dehydrogenase subunit GcvPB [Rhodospirillales bacterium]
MSYGARPTATTSGHRGLDWEEPLLFDQGAPQKCGVDLPEVDPMCADRLGGLRRRRPVGLPGLSEPEVVRHYLRLSRKNYAIDANMYPLGSCTMKHNPRINEKVARLPGIGDLHPLQPVETVQGALAIIDACAGWLKALTGLPAVAMSPAAGAHGELTGLMCIRAALEDRGDARKRVLVPESAHGTNPASARACGYAVESIPADADGRVNLDVLRQKLDTDVAAIMLTIPNTCGVFESAAPAIAEAVRGAGAFFYCDGANFNAYVGRVRPGDLGVDCMHINLHKTFSTPHGGGGPGSGPVVLSETLAPYAPLPYVVNAGDGLRLVEHASDGGGKPFGRVKAFHGQMGMFVRALAYMMSMGADGLRQVSGDAVLNANYLLARLKGTLTPAFEGLCMHEVLFDERALKGTGVTTLDLAKALIDEGFHPMTIYFPLVVNGAMLVEPTETESKETLDTFVASLEALVGRARSGDAKFFEESPTLAPRRRLDETRAARTPVLRWTPPAAASNHAAE